MLNKSKINSQQIIKIGIWIYFFLLLFEGGLRKWILPTLAGPLALVRDPIAIFLVLFSLRQGLLSKNNYLIAATFFGVTALATTFLTGHGNLGVSIYGARIMLIHFPVIFIIGKIFNKDDLLKMGKIMLWIAIPMSIIMVLQFYSPQSAWVNRGVGGDLEGAGFSGALGYYRPPGTFSFITGLTQFYGLLACFVFYFWLRPGIVNKYLLITATLGLLAAIPFSISRTLLYQTIIIFIFSIFVVSRKIKNLPKLVFGGIGIVAVLIFLSTLSILETPMEAFTSRFVGATKYEGGVSGTLIDRYLGGMFEAIRPGENQSIFGNGLGSGTNAGAKILLNTGMHKIHWVEEEWQRITYESGIILGFGFIFIRIILGIQLIALAFQRLIKDSTLPWLLVSFCLILLPNGQWGQPTSLGFAIIATGLTIASLKK
ncbi:hypothetical protein [Maribacter dokdonensis]|uniref:hypothetical protein n=1 Tax=Maribacter dokdonensis TaxID=320912 RepID=UPI0032921B87